MNNEFEHLPLDESIKAENDFLKMKLMLENGAVFGNPNDREIPSEIENEFLKHIIEFEKQADHHKTISVFNKLGKPVHFRPVSEIADEEMEKAWNELYGYMGKYGISLAVCSPNISIRELYRFVLEELFEFEMEDIDIPGMMHGFIYDEFHPDLKYENTSTAKDDCIRYILQKEPMEWSHFFRNENLTLNQHTDLSVEELKIVVNMFKMDYDDLEIKYIRDHECTVDEDTCFVCGTYSVIAYSGKEKCELKGDWKVSFERSDFIDHWYIVNVQIEGIRF